MTKTQRLRNVADGFMAGLVLAGYRGPWRWAHHQWEGSFYRVWRQWPPKARSPKTFPQFQVGGGPGATSQARDMLWQLKSTSPFHDYQHNPLTTNPAWLTVEEFVDVYTEGATAAEWRQLAYDFLYELARWVPVQLENGPLVRDPD